MSRVFEIPLNDSSETVLAGCAWVDKANINNPVMLVFVHQWGLLGGSSKLMEGLARCACSAGVDGVTFDLRGIGKSTGSASLCNSTEVADVKVFISLLVYTYCWFTCLRISLTYIRLYVNMLNVCTRKRFSSWVLLRELHSLGPYWTSLQTLLVGPSSDIHGGFGLQSYLVGRSKQLGKAQSLSFL